jgi:hypothetical protein
MKFSKESSVSCRKSSVFSGVIQVFGLSVTRKPGNPKICPHRLAVPLTQKRSIDTDLSQDRFSSFSPSLSASTSLPSSSSPSSAIPQVVPRPSSHHSNDFPHPPSFSKNHSSLSSHIGDVLSQGDIVGEGIPILGEPLRLVSNRFAEHVPVVDHQEPVTEFEVIAP